MDIKVLNHYSENLCGDHIQIVEIDDNSTVIVLSDSLGSGVKASILSRLTSKIIFRMMAESLSIEEYVSTIAATLQRVPSEVLLILHLPLFILQIMKLLRFFSMTTLILLF